MVDMSRHAGSRRGLSFWLVCVLLLALPATAAGGPPGGPDIVPCDDTDGETGPIIEALTQTAVNLEQAGAEIIGMPCNTAHAFLDHIRSAVAVPVVDMVRESAARALEIFGEGATVGLLATDGTLGSRLYHEVLAEVGLVPSSPSEPDVQRAVMDAMTTVKLHGISKDASASFALAVGLLTLWRLTPEARLTMLRNMEKSGELRLAPGAGRNDFPARYQSLKNAGGKLSRIAPARLLAMLRGESDGALMLTIDAPDEKVRHVIQQRHYPADPAAIFCRIPDAGIHCRHNGNSIGLDLVRFAEPASEDRSICRHDCHPSDCLDCCRLPDAGRHFVQYLSRFHGIDSRSD